MKKLFVILVAILLLTIMACSSKGGDSSSNSSSSTTTSATINSTGGSVQLSDGANVTIPSGVVADNTQITLTKLAQPQVYASGATAATDSYQITIPAGSTTTQSNGSNNLVTFQIPVPSSISTSVKKVLSKIKALVSDSISNDAYNASEVTISDGTNTKTLYGAYYVPSSGMVTMSIPAGVLTLTSGDPTITVTGINMSNYFLNVLPQLYAVVPSSVQGGSPTFTPVSADQTKNLSGTTPIILIHGWQIYINSPDPMQDCWDDFINYFNLNSSLYFNFTLYSFDYPTAAHVEANAQTLASLISSYFPSQKVVIIAHSMGGVVAHSYIQEYGGGSKVLKLITLATPYHGSPLMQWLHNSGEGMAVLNLTNSFLALSSPGSFDLEWDNYNSDSGIPAPSSPYSSTTSTSGSPYYLTALYNDLKTQYANLYCAFAGNIYPNTDGVNVADPLLSLPSQSSLPHGYYDILGEEIQLYGKGYPSDGVVPLVSAFATDTDGSQPSGFVIKSIEDDYDHGQMTGKSSTDPLFDQIGSVLLALLPSSYNIFGVITDSNSIPLPGVIVNLSGSHPSSTTTDANGNYSFNVAYYGIYTVTPVLTGYSFDPAITGVTVDGTNANFIISNITATANPVTTYNISGAVTLNGTGLAGVTVTLTGTGSTSTVTDANGGFTFTNAANGSYTLSFLNTGYTFSPSSVNVVVNGANFTVASNIIATSTASSTATMYVYVANESDGTVSQYTIGTDGSLTPMSTPTVATGSVPRSITVDPSGKYVYVANAFSNNVSQYTIGTNGSLTPMSTLTVAAGSDPLSITVDPSGKYAYVANMASNNVSQYTIGTDGSLTPMSTPTVAAGSSPASIKVDPSGKYVYVTNYVDYTVSQYTIGTDGSLTPMRTPTVAVGSWPYSITVDPSGKYVYVAHYSGNVSQYTIGTDGSLTPMSTPTVAAGMGSMSIAVDPSGNYIYVANNGDGTVSQYTIGTDGSLTPMSTPTVAAGSQPRSIAIAGVHTFTISGKVTSVGGIGLAGYTITLSGDGSGSTTTDSNGNYSFNVANGNYTVTPTGGTFVPTSIPVTVKNANVTGQNFTKQMTSGEF